MISLMKQKKNLKKGNNRGRMLFFHCKRADFIWISWILLFAFAVAMSAVMYNWIYGFTQSSAREIEKRTIDSQECESVSLSVDAVCQNTKNLYIDLSNRNNLNIDKIIVRLYNIYGEPIEPLLTKTLSLKPKESLSLVMPKDGVVKRIDVVPVTIQKRTEITCAENAAQSEDISFRESCR